MDLAHLMRRFPSEQAAINWIEAARWPEGPVCPPCGVVDEAYRLRCRPGQYTCGACRRRFSVTAGTALHRTHLPLRTCLLAMYLIATSSKGVSAKKLTSWLGSNYRTAWHLGHRLRAMMSECASGQPLLQGLVELDETYVGGRPHRVHGEADLPADQRPRRRQGRGTAKPCVFVAVARGGRVVPRVVASHSAADLGAAVRATVDASATLLPDELPAYIGVGRTYARHEHVTHSGDAFVRRDPADPTGLAVHVNTAESWNATLKRAIVGMFHYVSRKHLPRYAAESAFRWNERQGLLARVASLFQVRTSPLSYRALVA